MNGEIISIENARKIAKYEKALRVIKKQKDEINKLKKIINQAIKYIEIGLANEEEAEELLNILNGVDEE